MPMSEHEQEVLAQLEQEFRPSLPARAAARCSKVSVSTRLVAAAVALPVGLLLMIVALVLDSALGVGIALLAYGLVLGSSTIVVDVIAQARRTPVQRPQPRTAPRPRRFFP